MKGSIEMKSMGHKFEEKQGMAYGKVWGEKMGREK